VSGPLTILVTASGAPGSPRLLRALRENGEREVRLVGVDMRDQSAGRFLCDAFHRVPPGDDPDYLDRLAEVAESEEAGVVFPQSSAEVRAVAAGRARFGVPVLVSSPEAVERANAKSETVRIARELGIPQPRTIEAHDAHSFRAAAAELGYPGRDVCMKPLEAKGSRGFRVLSASADRRNLLLDGRPGTALPLSVEEAADALDSGPGFPPMLVMELVEGDELAVDVLCRGGRTLIASAKTREAFRAGLAMEFRIVHRPDLLQRSRALVEALGLDWIVNVQFLGDRLLEVNPRVSTLVYQPDLNLPWLAVRLALGELDEDAVAAYASRVQPGRRVTRYYEQVEYHHGGAAL
jgi:ATP-grasp domain-containing protein/3-methyl-D-ornithine--L-lysine ligase PylC-like protein